jgi:tetratricopeptide (TPR) repeat protein
MNEEAAIAEPVRYRAFISYSHADAKFAHWLHRKLESWRLPDQRRLTPVFIDRAELSAGSDLSAQVQAALEQSAALVVVCSPNARASRWVGLEIELFRSLHPDRPVLAALIEGEPDEAFPDPLVRSGDTAIEPLAADFRKGHDGQRLGLIKLVAGLSGLPLDRLVQRDAAARQRRVMAVTAGALALVLVLSAALIIALRARAEAERQRAEAEGLVEFMLTDLRDKLRGTGDPKIMATVNQRALDYYSHMDVTNLSDDSLDRRARVLHAMGEDNERLGNFPAAQKMYMEAWRITDEVLKRHPKDPDAIFAHAQSEFWVGNAAWLQGNLETTSLHWRGYLSQAEALARTEPQAKRSLMELGFANGNLCELTSRREEEGPARALPFCRKSSDHMRNAMRRFPNDPKIALALANRLGWEADIEAKLKRYDAAIELRREEAAILDGLLSADPKNSTYKERRLWPQVGIGRALLDKGEGRQAIAVLLPVLDEYDALAKARSNDTVITEQRMRVTWMIAKASRNSGLSDAGIWIERSKALHGQLRRTHTSEQMVRFDKMIAQLMEGEPT